jgi:hypothetical protein
MNVILSLFIETSKHEVGVVEKNVKGSCKHACSFEHVRNFHMRILDYKIFPRHFTLASMQDFPSQISNATWKIKIKNQKLTSTIYYI